jgi:hypothetical protein
MRVFRKYNDGMADFEGVVLFRFSTSGFSTRYNSVSFIPISYLSDGKNGGRSHLIVEYVLFQ